MAAENAEVVVVTGIEQHTAIAMVNQAISILIMQQLQGMARHQYFPNTGPDEMDWNIKNCDENVKRLRKMREEFENLVTGALLKGYDPR